MDQANEPYGRQTLPDFVWGITIGTSERSR